MVLSIYTIGDTSESVITFSEVDRFFLVKFQRVK